jgi:PPOX class probable FMN-dependent enzyme
MSDITTPEQLRDIYRAPAHPALAKQHARLDEHDRAFLAHSPFVVVATTDAAGGCDVSPKGGPPGFVQVLDDATVALPDLAGNNRLDSMGNLLESAGIGLLFFVPGRCDTLRVNGRARLSSDDRVLDATTVAGARPKVAIVVAVEEVFLHCQKALRRASLWDPSGWPATDDLASAGAAYRDQLGLDVTAEQIDASLERSYAETLWQPPS